MHRSLAALIAVTMFFAISGPGALAANGALTVEVDHLVLKADGTDLAVTEILELNNTGTERSPSLSVELPAGFRDLSLARVPAELGATAVAAGFTLDKGIPAGSTRLVVSYRVPYSSELAQITRVIRYPTKAVYLLVASGLALEGAGFTEEGTVDMGNGLVYRQYSRLDVPEGSRLEFAVKPGAAVAAPSGSSAGTAPVSAEDARILNKQFHGDANNVMLWNRTVGVPGHAGIYGVLILFALLGLGAWAFLAYRKSRRGRAARAAGFGIGAAATVTGTAVTGSAAAASRPNTSLEEEKAILVRQIARLDRQYKNGEIGADDYSSTRERHKQRLKEIMIALRSRG